jgi:hypothetical protein
MITAPACSRHDSATMALPPMSTTTVRGLAAATVRTSASSSGRSVSERRSPPRRGTFSPSSRAV